jgi:hypothetical protein
MHASPSIPEDLRSTSAFGETLHSVGDELGDLPDECSFLALCEAYGPTGGVAWGEDLDRTLRSGGCERSLARLLASRQVLGFEWRGTTWVPMAQFALSSLELKPGFLQVWSELADDLDGWEVATWFARRNTWLSGQRPADLLDADLPAVLNAARTDRFVSVGC